MELRQLRYLCAVVDHGTFTRAAIACSIAQPSLSQQILNLEDELGQPLLVRRPRRIELTDAGRSVLQHARVILRESESLRHGMEQRAGLLAGSVIIGIIPTMAPFLLPTQVASFRQAHPGVRLRMRESRTARLMEELVAGQLDFAIVSDITPADRRKWSLQVRELFHERLLLALPRQHPLANTPGAVQPDQIPREQMIVLSDGHCLGDQTLRICRLQRSEDRLECEQLETLLAMVDAGLGVGIVPEMATHRSLPAGIVTRQLTAPEPERIISIVQRRTAGLSPAADAFLDYFIRRARPTDPPPSGPPAIPSKRVTKG
jgi:LysR family hydrogen peroxide-inducible transcriptional activator